MPEIWLKVYITFILAILDGYSSQYTQDIPGDELSGAELEFSTDKFAPQGREKRFTKCTFDLCSTGQRLRADCIRVHELISEASAETSKQDHPMFRGTTSDIVPDSGVLLQSQGLLLNMSYL